MVRCTACAGDARDRLAARPKKAATDRPQAGVDDPTSACASKRIRFEAEDALRDFQKVSDGSSAGGWTSAKSRHANCWGSGTSA
jgi:hypothetical protein